MATSSPEHVILIHGLWMRSFTLALLRRRIQAAGYSVELFDYASVFRRPEPSVERLLRRVEKVANGKIHLVGHSLGGLLALHAAKSAPHLIRGHIVCLGTPLRGSAVARRIAAMPGGGWVLGNSTDVLHDGIERWDGHQNVGSIAGRLPVGLGLVLGALVPPHDGTVSVAETEVPGLTDHCVIAASHTGLPFSSEAAAETATFLRNGHFTRNRY